MIFGSATTRLDLSHPVQYQPKPTAEVGDLVVAEVLTENPAYPYLEQPDGTMHRLHTGDRIVGVLGSRQALRGYVGYAPNTLREFARLSLLNMGGVIGHFIDSTSVLGEPVQVRYLGTVVDTAGTVSLKRMALPYSHQIDSDRPVVLVIGTCMNTGKTVTASKLIEAATRAGFQVGAAKVSGVAALKDLKQFTEAGAVDVRSFLDCGLPSTVDAEDLCAVVRSVVNAVAGDLVIVEFGDGILGHYKVESVLTDIEVMSRVAAVVVCASDLMGAYGAKLYLEQLHIPITAFSGLVTDNVSGSGFIESRWGVPAINALKNPQKLFEALGIPAPGYVLHMLSRQSVAEEVRVG